MTFPTERVEWTTEVTVSVYQTGEAYIMFPTADDADTVRTTTLEANVDIDNVTGKVTGIEILNWPGSEKP
jgi:hypothetical protein